MNLFDFFYLQLLSESEIDEAFRQAEQAIWDLIADHGLIGIVTGGAVVQHSPTADLTVDLPALIAYDSDGRRIRLPSLQRIAVDEDYLGVSTDVAVPGNEKIVSIFVYFDRDPSNPRIDGNGVTVYYDNPEFFRVKVKQGAESAAPATPPALEADKILVAEIRRRNPQTQVLNSDITPPGGSYAGITNRRQDAFVLSSGSLAVRAGTAEASDQALLNIIETLTTADGIAVDASGDWHDGTTNPADDLQARLNKIISDLAGETTGALNAGGGAMIGHFDLPPWLNGGGIATPTPRPAQSVLATLIQIQQHLEAQTPGQDGMVKIGAEARTGATVNLAAGTAASQIQEVIDELGGLSTDNTWTGTAEFDSTVQFDAAANVTSTGSLKIQSGGLIRVQSGATLEVQSGSTATVSTILEMSGADAGIANRTATLDGTSDQNLDVGTDTYIFTAAPTALRTYTLLDTTGNTPVDGQRIRVSMPGNTGPGVSAVFRRETGAVGLLTWPPTSGPAMAEFEFINGAWHVSMAGGSANIAAEF